MTEKTTRQVIPSISSLAQQIQLAAAGSSTVPSTTNKRLLRWSKVQEKGWDEHTKQAIAKYRSVMINQGWLTSFEIECKLGYTRTSSTVFIKKLLTLGLIERRNKDGVEKYCRRSGYQYRWRT